MARGDLQKETIEAALVPSVAVDLRVPLAVSLLLPIFILHQLPPCLPLPHPTLSPPITKTAQGVNLPSPQGQHCCVPASETLGMTRYTVLQLLLQTMKCTG